MEEKKMIGIILKKSFVESDGRFCVLTMDDFPSGLKTSDGSRLNITPSNEEEYVQIVVQKAQQAQNDGKWFAVAVVVPQEYSHIVASSINALVKGVGHLNPRAGHFRFAEPAGALGQELLDIADEA